MEVQDNNDNQFQTTYVPASQAGSASDSMIPKDLATATTIALNNLQREYGDIDAFVAKNLSWTVEELSSYLSQEQVDAVGLAITRVQKSRGFIAGDETGKGKGRIMATMMRYAFMNGYTPIFLTDTPDLFSDIYRDLKGINSENIFRPFILNSNVSIRNMDGTVAISSIPADEIAESLVKENIPVGYNAVLATYSQFNRKLEDSPKGGFLHGITENNIVLLDESHKASGSSNTSINIMRGIARSAGTVFSSATFSKGAKNMTLYSNVFPKSISMGVLAETLATGGESVQEILSVSLAQDGAMIRREHDAESVELSTVFDEERIPYLEGVSDKFTDILIDLAMIDVANRDKIKNDFLDLKEKLLQQGSVTKNLKMERSMGFGTRVYTLLRQFSMVVKASYTAQMVVDELRAGRKPAVMVEQTLETALKGAFEAGVRAEDMSFRDLLRRVAFRGSHNKVTDPAVPDGFYWKKIEIEGIDEKIAMVNSKIDAFPDFPLSPIDYIHDHISDNGFNSVELSGRALQLRKNTETGILEVTKRKKENKVKSVHAFNNGDADAVIFTRSACAGISMHSDADFEDQRQRVLFELEIFSDVSNRKQGWGRFNRKGQVSTPIIKSISSGLPNENRILAMQERKLKGLQSTTTSNGESKMHIEGVIDILNPVGDTVTRKYLEENPSLVDLFKDLGVEFFMNGEEGSYAEMHFVNKLTGYISLMPVAEQRQIYDDLSEEYKRHIEELDAAGNNPLKTKRLDWKAKTISKELFCGEEYEVESVFEEPVYLRKIEYELDIKPIPYNIVERIIAKNTAMLTKSVDADEGVEPSAFHAAWLKENLMTLLGRFTSVKWPSIAEAIRSDESNGVKTAYKAIKNAYLLLEELPIGTPVYYRSIGGIDLKRGLIVNLNVPVDTSAHCLGQYEITILPESGEKPIVKTFYGIAKDPAENGLSKMQADEAKDMFDRMRSSKPFTKNVTAYVLDGNMFLAAEMAVINGLGNCISYTDEAGDNQRGVLIKSEQLDLILNDELPIRLSSNDEAVDFIRSIKGRYDMKLWIGIGRNSPHMARAKPSINMLSNGNIIMQIPVIKNARNIYDDEVLNKIKTQKNSRKGSGSMTFSEDKLEELTERLLHITALTVDPKFKDWVNDYRSAHGGQSLNSKLTA